MIEKELEELRKTAHVLVSQLDALMDKQPKANKFEIEIEDVKESVYPGNNEEGSTLRISLDLHWVDADGSDNYATIHILLCKDGTPRKFRENDLIAGFDDTLEDFTHRILDAFEGEGAKNPTFDKRSQEVLNRIYTQWIWLERSND